MNKTAETAPATATRGGRRVRVSEPSPREHGTGRFAKRHAARSLARHLAAGNLDGRTWVARALKGIRDELAADRGCFRPTDDAEKAAQCHNRTCEHLTAGER